MPSSPILDIHSGMIPHADVMHITIIHEKHRLWNEEAFNYSLCFNQFLLFTVIVQTSPRANSDISRHVAEGIKNIRRKVRP